MSCPAVSSPPVRPAVPEFRAAGYALYRGRDLLLYGPPAALEKIAAALNEAPPPPDVPGALPRAVMRLIQGAGGGIYVPREGLRGAW